jgi:hypothetical protein
VKTTFFVVWHQQTGCFWPRFAEQTRPRWRTKLNSACLFASRSAAEKALLGTHFPEDERAQTRVVETTLSFREVL